MERIRPQFYIPGVAWLLLGLAAGLRFPDVDNRLGWLLPTWVLLHRSILTHGFIIPLLLYRLVGRRAGAGVSPRLFVIGLSLAFAVHLGFDFFPRGWTGFALIHIPVYGRTAALFSQSWVVLSAVGCLYLGFLLVRNLAELVLGLGSLIISFAVSAVENGRAVLPALVLLALAAASAVLLARRAGRAAAGREIKL